MWTFVARGDGTAVELDACRTCEILWFDRAELEQMGVRFGVAAASTSTIAVASPGPVERSASADGSSDGYAGHALGFVLEVLGLLLG